MIGAEPFFLHEHETVAESGEAVALRSRFLDPARGPAWIQQHPSAAHRAHIQARERRREQQGYIDYWLWRTPHRPTGPATPPPYSAPQRPTGALHWAMIGRCSPPPGGEMEPGLGREAQRERESTLATDTGPHGDRQAELSMRC